jgi:exopolysaccharide biosynthesis polyprenyl glycosylphosphotransferase
MVPEIGVLLVADALGVIPALLVFREPFVVVLLLCAVLTWSVRRLYRRRTTLAVLDDLSSVVLGVLVGTFPAALLVVPSRVLTGWSLLGAGCLIIAGMAVGRAAAYTVILQARRTGRRTYRTLLVGSGASTTALVHRIRAHPESGLRLVGCLSDQYGHAPVALPVLGAPEDLADVVEDNQVSDVVIGYGGLSSARLVDVLRRAECAGVEIHIVPRLFELRTVRTFDDHLWGLPLVQLRNSAQRVVTWHAKRAFDVTLSVAALVLLLPVLAVVAGAVRWSLGPGVIFRQTRVGLDGRVFDLLKFRSVPRQVTLADGAPWTVPSGSLDPVGRVIRRYSLDELPQLVNVVRGDMSLVGPRPERPEYVQQFAQAVPRYELRHRVPAGLTGLAAVNGLRGDTSIEERAQFDNWYIENWCLWLDVKILLRTLGAVLRGAGS